jgi:hypothetical protein
VTRWPPGFWLALVVFVSLRALVLHTAFDEVGLWMYEINPMGTIAELALRGVRVPAYFFYDNAAGQVLAGYLAVPAFLVLGSTYLALKLVPFAMGVGTFFLVFALLRDAFPGRAAMLGAWLLALGPTTLFKYSIVCSGNHFENLFFTSIVLVLFYRMHRKGITAPRLLAAGAAAGFSVFVFLGAVIPVGILAGVHAWVRGFRATLRDLPALLGGFLAGVAPLLALNAFTAGRGANYLAAKFGESDAPAATASGSVLARSGSYLFEKLPISAAYPDVGPVSAGVLSWTFAIAIAVAMVAALASILRRSTSGRFDRVALAPFVLYLPLSALAFGLSNLVVYELTGPLRFSAFRYFLPVLLFGIVALAVVCARGIERGGAMRAGAAALYAAAFLPGLANLRLVDWSFSSTGLGSKYDGYDLSKLARTLLAPKNRLGQAEITRYLGTFPGPLRARVARALGFNLAVGQVLREGHGLDSVRKGRIDLEALVAPYDDADREELARGAGIGARFLKISERAELEDLLALLERSRDGATSASAPLVPAFLEGAAMTNPSLPLASAVPGVLGETGGLVLRARDGHSGDLDDGLARGDGILCGALLRRGIESDRRSVERAIENLPSEIRDEFYRGLGRGCAEGRDEPGLPDGLAVPPESRAAFWSGFSAAVRATHGQDADRLLPALEEKGPGSRANGGRAP